MRLLNSFQAWYRTKYLPWSNSRYDFDAGQLGGYPSEFHLRYGPMIFSGAMCLTYLGLYLAGIPFS